MDVDKDNSENVDNILDLNDDCLITIMKNLELIDLCAIAETCKRFQFVASEACRSRGNMEYIMSVLVDGECHERILKHFGHIVTSVSCVTRFCGWGISAQQMKLAFKWLERYCESLEKINIISAEIVILPKSAMRLMAKMKQIVLMAPIRDNNLRAALMNSKQLVDLTLRLYDGPFHFPDHRFPHLRSLINRVRVGPRTDYNQIETFFKHHTGLTSLDTQFLNDESNGVIDLTFMKHLTNLTKLSLTLGYAKIVGTDAFTHLKHLQELWIDGSDDKQTDAKVLENLASVDSLVKLSLGFPDVSHLITGIGRFKNLSNLEITEGNMSPDDVFHAANIASLAQLNNSNCTKLKVCCSSLLEPETLVDVVRNLQNVKTIELSCEVALSEVICKQLARVCSSQKRKIRIILDADIVQHMKFDFNFIDKFNTEFGEFVEIDVE